MDISSGENVRPDIQELCSEILKTLETKENLFSERIDKARASRAFLRTDAAEPEDFADYLLENSRFIEQVNLLDFDFASQSEAITRLLGLQPAPPDQLFFRRTIEPFRTVSVSLTEIQQLAKVLGGIHSDIQEAMLLRLKTYENDAREMKALNKVRHLLQQYPDNQN